MWILELVIVALIFAIPIVLLMLKLLWLFMKLTKTYVFIPGICVFIYFCAKHHLMEDSMEFKILAISCAAVSLALYIGLIVHKIHKKRHPKPLTYDNLSLDELEAIAQIPEVKFNDLEK